MSKKRSKEDLDLIFSYWGKNFDIEPLWLKAIATCESALNPFAYRYEPAFWTRYMKDDPVWRGKDPKLVSASYGLMQVMVKTAYDLGYRGSPEGLYDPDKSVELGAKLLRKNLSKIITTPDIELLPIEISTCQYNGGSRGNPRPDGTLRNQSYLTKVKKAYWKLRLEEANE